MTGAGSGLGQEMARRLAIAGTIVHAIDRNDIEINPGPESGDVIPHTLDVTNAAGLRDTLRPVADDIDLVVAAAGIGVSGRVVDTPFETFETAIRINYLGVVATVDAVLERMLAAGRGRIIIFASIAGWVPGPSHSAYNATKAALVMYADVLRMEVAPHGVHVHTVCPPAVSTPLLDALPVAKANVRGPMKTLTPARVIDAIERDVARDRSLILPDLASRSMWRLQRHFPKATERLMGRFLIEEGVV